jgi:predicted ATP-dependent endonuclease of OLD family
VAGFRCFPWDAPLSLRLQRGLNILVGPNDAGKTAVIDAPRYVLWTRGDDYVRLEATDFHAKADGTRASELLIRCIFEGLSPDEEARFLEWCTNESGSSISTYVFVALADSCLVEVIAFLRSIAPGKTPIDCHWKENYANI